MVTKTILFHFRFPFHSRFSLILFIFLVFQRTIILFGVKAWYFYYGKCSLAVGYDKFYS